MKSEYHREEQKRQLLHVIVLRQTVVPEDGTVIPEFLDEGGGVGHWFPTFGRSTEPSGECALDNLKIICLPPPSNSSRSPVFVRFEKL